MGNWTNAKLCDVANLSRDSRLDQRKLRALLVQGVDGMVDRTIERISVGEGLVCEMV